MNQEDMYKQKVLLGENRLWFNRFFQDLSGLLERMNQRVGPRVGASGQAAYYYQKSNSTPAIPDYLLMGLSGDGVTLQVYSIFDPKMLQRKYFSAEPSFVVIRLSRPGLQLHAWDFGLRVIAQDDSVTISETTPQLSGQLPNGVHFQAFQIDRELVQRVAQLPDFQTNDNP